MCEFIEEGIKMTDGYIIKWDVDISNLPSRYVDELVNANLWHIFIVRRADYQLRTDLQAGFSNLESKLDCLDKKITKFLTEDQIRRIINDEIANAPRKALSKFSKIATEISLLLTAFSIAGSALAGAYVFISQLMKGEIF